MKRFALALLAGAVLTACASAPSERRERGLDAYADDARLGEETNRICFASNIDGFSMNERETVLLHEGRERYMVEVTPGCHDLEHAEAIAIDNTMSCITPGDAIIVSQAMGGTFGTQRCLITEIREWNRKAEQEVKEPVQENPS